jgi:hypothetical protein
MMGTWEASVAENPTDGIAIWSVPWKSSGIAMASAARTAATATSVLLKFFTYLREGLVPLYNSRSKKGLFCLILLVQSPQPECNPNQLLNQKRLFLQKVMEDEVAGLHSLLQLIKKINN